MHKRKFAKRISIWFVCILASVTVLFLASFRDNDYKIIKSFDIFYAVFKEVIQNYADETDPEKLVSKGINSMLSTLDPYTYYFSEEESKMVKQMHTGKYGGIGATIMQFENRTLISDVIENCPAQKSGIKQGDVLLAVDSTKLNKENIGDIGTMLKGEPNTYVNLTIERMGAVKTIRVKRETISIPNVPYYGMVSDSIGYIRLGSFANDAARDVKNAYKELRKKNTVTGLILDLRSNPGGLLNEAVDIANLFVNKGQVIVSLRKRNTVKLSEYKTSHYPLDEEIPLAVLINGESASASEVVSGSIQDLERGIVMGQKSYGKGLVQTELPMPYKGYLNLTTSKYYIPSGRCIQAVDYFKKDKNGTAPRFADSLKRSFKTKYGRTVYDGGGITPDIILTEDTLAPFVAALISKNLLFFYANHYAASHAKIPNPKEFELTDADFKDFQKFTADRGFHFTTDAEKQLEKLTQEFTKSSQLHQAKELLEKLNTIAGSDQDKLFLENKNRILGLLKDEICSRYYYTRGEMEAFLGMDKVTIEAIKVLKDKKRYQDVLKPKNE